MIINQNMLNTTLVEYHGALMSTHFWLLNCANNNTNDNVHKYLNNLFEEYLSKNGLTKNDFIYSYNYDILEKPLLVRNHKTNNISVMEVYTLSENHVPLGIIRKNGSVIPINYGANLSVTNTTLKFSELIELSENLLSADYAKKLHRLIRIGFFPKSLVNTEVVEHD